MKNELELRDKKEVEAHLQNVWKTMKDCIEHGIKTEGVLPGRIKSCSSCTITLSSLGGEIPAC